ncbi:hypothetical protein Tco_0866471 [Tanacetum coccineum]
MAPKRATRSTPATTTTTTSVTNAQLKALIDQGIADALAARDAERSRNGEDSHDSSTGVRRQAPPTQIAALRAADRARQAQLVETLRLMSTLQTQKMAPKRTTRSNPSATTATTSVTNSQLNAMIDQGVTDALAARDANRNTNGDDNHNSDRVLEEEEF